MLESACADFDFTADRPTARGRGEGASVLEKTEIEVFILHRHPVPRRAQLQLDRSLRAPAMGEPRGSRGGVELRQATSMERTRRSDGQASL
jgi:hypothetical protein